MILKQILFFLLILNTAQKINGSGDDEVKHLNEKEDKPLTYAEILNKNLNIKETKQFNKNINLQPENYSKKEVGQNSKRKNILSQNFKQKKIIPYIIPQLSKNNISNNSSNSNQLGNKEKSDSQSIKPKVKYQTEQLNNRNYETKKLINSYSIQRKDNKIIQPINQDNEKEKKEELKEDKPNLNQNKQNSLNKNELNIGDIKINIPKLENKNKEKSVEKNEGVTFNIGKNNINTNIQMKEIVEKNNFSGIEQNILKENKIHERVNKEFISDPNSTSFPYSDPIEEEQKKKGLNYRAKPFIPNKIIHNNNIIPVNSFGIQSQYYNTLNQYQPQQSNTYNNPYIHQNFGFTGSSPINSITNSPHFGQLPNSNKNFSLEELGTFFLYINSFKLQK
ncbi:hypothetical protein Mgra_00004646 [Meloidogyne graminicola]|uniref:Uncharacterized protein n=1 Tax=Meloidogyne graminicola TaxID=189291 RepID=A0A8S9ZRN6_9BILA|nr:hypothetical protein Mgra_00004646 [Meloidogyne graminicola]